MTDLSVALVCLGNICRSPMADVVLRARIEEAGLGDAIAVASGGTGDWHVGKPMDHRAAAVLAEHGYDPSRHRARHVTRDWIEEHDLLLAMDRENLAVLRAAAGPERAERVRLFRDFDPVGTGGVVPDPYYGGASGFEEVLEMVERTSVCLLDALEHRLAGDQR